MLWRILTESNPNLNHILDKYLDGYTLYLAQGFWKGSEEKAAIIEIAGISHGDKWLQQDWVTLTEVIETPINFRKVG